MGRADERLATMKTVKRVTMHDIARAAGVSPITVSRALAGPGSVKAETRAKVLKVAESMGYKFNYAARNLRQQRTRTIAVVIEMQPNLGRSIGEPYPLSLLGGIIEELALADYSAMLSTADQFLRLPSAVDGVILLGQGERNDAVSRIESCGLPLIVWGSANRDGGEHIVVGSDNIEGGRLAGRHMLSNGRLAAIFLGDVGHGEAADRLEGFSESFEGDGGEVIGSIACDFTFDAGFAAMHDALDTHGDGFDAVFAASDSIAMGAITALKDAGREVPKDVSVVGFDDAVSAQLFSPPLSTIHQDWHEGGRLLARNACTLIGGETAQSTILPVQLIARGT